MFFSLFRVDKMKFHHRWSPLKKIPLATPWKNPLLPLLWGTIAPSSSGKNPSDARAVRSMLSKIEQCTSAARPVIDEVAVNWAAA